MNTMFHRCPRYSVRSVHLRPLLLEKFLDILAARRHLAVTYSKCRSRHRARIDPMTRCHSPSTPIHRRAPRPRRRPRPTAREPMSTRRVFRPPHALLVTRVSPNQSNAAPLIGARAKNSQAASARAPVARRGAPAAAAPSARSASNVHKLADAKYARLKRPVLEDAPPPGAARQLLLRRGLLGDQVSVARERRYLRLRRRCSGVERRRRTMPRRRRV